MRLLLLLTVLVFFQQPIIGAEAFPTDQTSISNGKGPIISQAAEDIWQRSLPGKVTSVSPYNTQFETKLSAMKKKTRGEEFSSKTRVGTASIDVTRRSVVTSGVSTALVTPLLTEGFSRLGALFLRFDKLKYPEVPPGVTEMTIIFHGANGLDENTDALLANLLERQEKSSSNNKNDPSKQSYSFLMDWSVYSKNLVQAAYNGERIGRELAKRLPARINKVHIIGISVGAMAADACVVELKTNGKRHPSKVYIQETLLDPLCARGVLDLEYGEREFGRHADYAQQILNTDDPVPFTNLPCTKCAVFDITPCRPEEVFGHDWPIQYYNNVVSSKRSRKGSISFGFVEDAQKMGRGVVVTVDK